jgi:hypothetical protein
MKLRLLPFLLVVGLFVSCSASPKSAPEDNTLSILQAAASRATDEGVDVDYEVDYCLFQGGGTARCFNTIANDGSTFYWVSYVNPFSSSCNPGPGYAPCNNGEWLGYPSFSMEPGTTGIVRTGDGTVAEIWEWDGAQFEQSAPLENGKVVYTKNAVPGQTAWWRTNNSNGWGWEWLDGLE